MSAGNSTQQPVEYRDIAGFPGYRVGNDGSVWCARKKIGKYGGGTVSIVGTVWRQLKQWPDKVGYQTVGFCKMPRLVHRLVLEAFVGGQPVGMECCHVDGNKANNHLTNLRWGTAKENAADRERHGNTARGQRNGFSRFTPEEIQSIRAEYATGNVSQRSLAKKHRTSQSHIQRIITMQAWGCVVS